jgi:glycosyltransferase involved in cell wall biosynthesis
MADVVVATNESYKRNALSRGAMSPSRVFVVRNGPPRSLAPVAPDPELRSRASTLVGYIGTMGPQDGVDYWLRALKELTGDLRRTDLLAVVIGNGDAMPALRQLVRELDIEQYVWFTGRIPDEKVRSILSTVDICVQPDPSGPLNDCSTMNKVMEYMAFSKPIVAFDLHETRFSAQGAALYARPNDVRDFASKVAWLMDHPQERQRMGSLGRRRMMDELAWEYSVPHLLRAYADGLSAEPGGTASVRDA